MRAIRLRLAILASLTAAAVAVVGAQTSDRRATMDSGSRAVSSSST